MTAEPTSRPTSLDRSQQLAMYRRALQLAGRHGSNPGLGRGLIYVDRGKAAWSGTSTATSTSTCASATGR